MLTEKIVQDARPGPKTQFLWDAKVAGLGLSISQGGAKSYVLSYRIHGRSRRMTLARSSEITLKEVRKLAGEHLVRARNGDDPAEKRRTMRKAPTVADGARRFFDEFTVERIKLGRMTEKTRREYLIHWTAHLEPKLGKRKIAEVSRRDIERTVKGKPPVTRNRVLALASRLFNLFEKWELRPQYSNPARFVERSREEPRDRIFSPAELGRLFKALEEHEGNWTAVVAIKIAAVTGLRISEVLNMRWADIDFETNRLTLPETKTGRRIHSLPAVAIEIVRELPHNCPWIFSSRGKVPITYGNVRKHFQEVTRAAGIEGVRLHDLRRSVMTMAAASGVSAHILQALLGHKTQVAASRYVRELGDPVREAREQVGAQIAEMMGG